MRPCVLFLCLLAVATSFAQMPRTLNCQGTLVTGSAPVPDGNYGGIEKKRLLSGRMRGFLVSGAGDSNLGSS